ncbi:unnamed protein product [Adineta ricciae]|uniref:Intradiol ring-cleavage dioxygenases domain-containing protein n=1 Tax=Adineta ricciae TaxID=249248 RepID=A0A814WXX4_ADIRI|nr:unnamed protein product [Adineta ricciae]CAF1208278.1 unnamed protein product [Adineta ricciae]
MNSIFSTTLLLGFLCLASNSVQGSARCRRAVSTCILTPETTEGPYSWNTTLMRQNISEDRPGIPFRLYLTVMNINTCEPIVNAAVEIWHCDALGIYSHYIQASNNVQNPKTDNSTYLRGMQLTNASGVATFDTIYPGWYTGRATHIHVRVHLNGVYVTSTGYYSDGSLVKTGQLFFNDSLTDLVAQQSPYSTHTITRTLNSVDTIYQSSTITLMDIQYVSSAAGLSGGMVTSATLGVSSSSTSSSTTTKASASTTTARTSSTTTVRTSRATTTTQRSQTGGANNSKRPWWQFFG